MIFGKAPILDAIIAVLTAVLIISFVYRMGLD